ncbi:MAG: aminotransferase class V-fold PLP-dependent enzyme, partial [Bacteroidota bacterium]
ALGTFTWGIDLKPGDEIVMTKQDYPNMIHAWKQREQREGIVIRWINIDLPVENDETLLKAYR